MNGKSIISFVDSICICLLIVAGYTFITESGIWQYIALLGLCLVTVHFSIQDLITEEEEEND